MHRFNKLLLNIVFLWMTSLTGSVVLLVGFHEGLKMDEVLWRNLAFAALVTTYITMHDFGFFVSVES